MSEEEEGAQRGGVIVLGVGSTDRTRQMLKDRNILPLDIGVVPGTAGALLNEGRWNNADVIALVVEAYSDVPDAKAAAAMVEAIVKLLPQIDLDVSPLHAEAEKIEGRLKTIREQAKPAQSPTRPTPYG
jgi:predicted ATP-grasp superfamily ATP-dependent carboligase